MQSSVLVAVAWCTFLVAGSVDAAAAAAALSTIRLTVTGGAHPGTWRVREMRGVCADGFSRPGEWSARYAVPTAARRSLGSLQLFVPAGQEAGSGTRQFSLSIVLGSASRPMGRYDVETRIASRRREGSGVATIVDHGATATVTFDATTADGVGLRGVIDCGFVDRAPHT